MGALSGPLDPELRFAAMLELALLHGAGLVEGAEEHHLGLAAAYLRHAAGASAARMGAKLCSPFMREVLTSGSDGLRYECSVSHTSAFGAASEMSAQPARPPSARRPCRASSASPSGRTTASSPSTASWSGRRSERLLSVAWLLSASSVGTTRTFADTSRSPLPERVSAPQPRCSCA